jgi:predicted dehydrogenase
MKTQDALTRRNFVKQVTLGTAAVAGGALLSRAAGGANERIGVAFIGTGDRGSYLMKELLPLGDKCNVEVRAVCDVWRKNREAAVARVKESGGREPKQFTRFTDLLALPEVDAVIIATPDFSHGPILVAALEAGKDVYVEKPMTIDIGSANRALDLARSGNRVVQAGTQRRSDPQFVGAAKFVASGALGKISRVSGAMNVNQARWARRFDDCRAEDVDWAAFCLGRLRRGFDPRLLRCWQLFRDTSNGISGLWMTHYSDAVHLITGAKYPDSAVALGGNYVWHDGREHADTFHALFDYPEGFLFNWSMGLGNAADVHFTVHGTQGTLDLEKWTCTPEAGTSASKETTKVAGEPVVGHMENWLQCLRSRERPHADIQFGHQHAVATIMAATAAGTGRRQRWDAVKREMIAG